MTERRMVYSNILYYASLSSITFTSPHKEMSKTLEKRAINKIKAGNISVFSN